jgi:hypothetical protein
MRAFTIIVLSTRKEKKKEKNPRSYTDKLLQLMIALRAKSSLSQEGNSAPVKLITQIGSIIRPMTTPRNFAPDQSMK